MSRQNRCPIHPEKLLRRQQRTGVNEFHGYEVLHSTFLHSPAFPSGLDISLTMTANKEGVNVLAVLSSKLSSTS
jgi:hypothetical protein